LADTPPALTELLRRHGQEQLLDGWDRLDPVAQNGLAEQIERLDLDELDELIRTLVLVDDPELELPSQISSPRAVRLPATDDDRERWRAAERAGEEALANGEVAAVVVAGGQGTRLGFDAPKGTYPIGAVSGATLFQIHIEKLVALGRRYGRTIPLYVMTSPDNHEATQDFLAEHGWFGHDRIRLFQQGTMPAVDRETGHILLAGPGQLALSPDGHGGTIRALAAPSPGGGASCLDEMRADGIGTIFYFQVDNPMTRIADPAFVGFHRQARAQVSFKVVEKVEPAERVGVVVGTGDRHAVIEYSDLPDELAEQRRPDGGLALWAGTIAVHVFDREFVEGLASGGTRLPFHRAVKAVPYLDADGQVVEPAEPNAVKFETFIFDALPLAERSAIVETDRAVEFEPLKNATGGSSPESVRAAMTELFAGWLEECGARVERDAAGHVPFPIEISPLRAMSAAELADSGDVPAVVDGALLLD
jgi:UDP-N-acetylglucosamine/UDP-N-acetylgalactosamine diphosphorylase